MKVEVTDKDISAHQKHLESIVKESLLPGLDDPFLRLHELVDRFRTDITRFSDRLRESDVADQAMRIRLEHLQFRKQILRSLDSWVTAREQLTADDILAGYDSKIHHYLLELPAYWIKIQPPARFNSLPQDTVSIRLIKYLKRTGYSISLRTHKLFNSLKAPFGGIPAPMPSWKQRLGVRQLAAWYYEVNMLEHYSKLIHSAHKKAACLAYDIWVMDDNLYKDVARLHQHGGDPDSFTHSFPNQIVSRLDGFQQIINNERSEYEVWLDAVVNDVGNEYYKQLSISGTLESPIIRHLELIRKYKNKRIRKSLTALVNKRLNTLFALADDWKFNQEIYLLAIKASKAKLQFRSRLHKRAGEIGEHIDLITVFLNQLKEKIPMDAHHPGKIEDEGNRDDAAYGKQGLLSKDAAIRLQDKDPDDETGDVSKNHKLARIASLRKQLQQLKYSADKNLVNNIIAEISSKLLQQNHYILIDELEKELLSELATKTRKRFLLAGFNPATDYSEQALQSISLSELVEFEIATELQRIFRQAKTQSIQKFQSLNDQFSDIGRMVLVNIESSIVMLDQQGEDGIENGFHDAVNALNRAIQRTSDHKDGFDHFMRSLQLSLDEAIDQFTNSLLGLTDNTKVETIRFRIMKVRAMKKKAQLSGSFRSTGKLLLAKGLLWNRFIRRKTFLGMRIIRGQLGLKAIARDISSEVSEFLVADQERLHRFPFVYRRLFANEPLTDKTFYFQRRSEFNQLLAAFNKWKEGSFTPVLVVGEKGSGISTLVQFFFKDHALKNIQTHRFISDKRVLSEEDFFSLLGNCLKGQAFESIRDFYEYVHLNEPFVVFVDKIHLLYLRQPGGFKLLKRFLELISHSSKKVFWLLSCNLYASVYLNKVIDIYGYFPNLISMQRLNLDDVKKLVLMRHNASGYYLNFVPSAENMMEKNYLKKDESEKQAYLQDRYFDALQCMTQSNISFALQLWLRSAKKIEDNTIHVQSMDHIDLSFVHSMSDEVVFGMHALILHEFLDVTQIAHILNTGQRQAYLMMMRLKDRGIVVEGNGSFFIQPLLYRQIINILKDKNFIH